MSDGDVSALSVDDMFVVCGSWCSVRTSGVAYWSLMADLVCELADVLPSDCVG